MEKITAYDKNFQAKKTVSGEIPQTDKPKKTTKPESIYICKGTEKVVNQLKKEFGNDDFLPLLANLDSTGSDYVEISDLIILERLDNKKKDFSNADKNIFKNAVNMYNANKENNIDFNGLLQFTAQYSDIENGDFGDGKFIPETPETENIFKKSIITQKDNEIEIKLNDFETSNDKNYSTYIFEKDVLAITYKTKNYANGDKYVIHNTDKTPIEFLAENGIKPINGKNKFVIDGKEYKYDAKELVFSAKNDKEQYIYNQTEKKMVTIEDAGIYMEKRLLGEKFYELEDKAEEGVPITEEIYELMKSDKTSLIGELLNFNDENKDNAELNKYCDVKAMNAKLKALFESGNINLFSEGEINGDADNEGLSLNYKILYNKQNDIFEIFYHELIHTMQPNEKNDISTEKEAQMGGKIALAIKNGTLNEQEEKDIEESVKYTLNYYYTYLK